MSSNGWETVTLGDVAEIIMGQSPAGETCNETGNGVPLLNGPTEFEDFHPKPVQYTTDPKKFSKVGDILFCVRGSTTGRMNWADQEYAIGRGLAAIRHKKGKEFQPFLKGILDYYLPYLLTEATGSTFPNVSSQQLNSLVVEVPPLSTQRRIANILSALDEKIELNRQTNTTLEAIAREMFTSWFIDFDPVYAKANGHPLLSLKPEIAKLFPDNFRETELGNIPVDWEVMTVEEVAERVAMGPFGSSIKVETFVDEGIPIISGQHLRGFMLTDSTYNYISLEHAEKLKKANVYHGDVIFTHAGNIENLAFIPEDSQYSRYVVSQRQFYLRCDLEKVTPTFITFYFQSPEGQHKLLANKSPVGVPSIAQPVTYLRSIKLPIPPKPILDAFEHISSPLLQTYQAKVHESQTLVNLRDTLLPRLLRGEIEI